MPDLCDHKSFPEACAASPTGLHNQHLLDWLKFLAKLPFASSFEPTPFPVGTLTSEAGVQQGDPLGPLTIAKDDSCQDLLINAWCLDDGVVAGPPSSVQDVVHLLQDLGPLLGLHLKCEHFSQVHITRSTPPTLALDELHVFNQQRARLLSLWHCPSPGLGLNLDPNEHQMAIKWWLGHNKLRDVVLQTCHKALAGSGLGRELLHTRPADILASNWLCGKTAAFDLTVTSPLNPSLLSEAGLTAGTNIPKSKVDSNLYGRLNLTLVWANARLLLLRGGYILR
eukprot:Em0017g548a